jgi:hypothetical protein
MKDQNTHKDSRRKFLVKTSAVSLISALPATSVWGACTVSGALSGGSKVNDDCTTITLSNGRSPGFWRDADTKTNGGAIADVFPYLKGPNANCERTHLMSVIGSTKVAANIYLGKNENGVGITININESLKYQGGIFWNLAAVYLNAVFGLYSSYLPVTLNSGDTITDGAELIKHLYQLYITDQINGMMPADGDMYYGFTDGSTTYQATGSNC